MKPNECIEDYVARLTLDEKQAHLRLIEDRNKHDSWDKVRTTYQQLVNDAPLCSSLRENFKISLERIDTLQEFESRYGDLNKYFKNGYPGSQTDSTS